MDNLENFLAETPEGEVAPVEAAEVVETTEPQEQETEAQAQQRQRDEKGRFKAKEAEEPVMVPLKALHETRDELKALKAELDRIQQASQQPHQPTPIPDMFEDPQAYTAHIQNQIAQVTLNERLNTSEELVRQSAGDETVNAAQEWGKQMLSSNPMFAQAFYQQRNPYGFLVAEYQRQQTFAQINDPAEVQAYLAWKQQQAQPKATPVVPSTLADAQSARGQSEALHVPSFDEILGRKA